MDGKRGRRADLARQAAGPLLTLAALFTLDLLLPHSFRLISSEVALAGILISAFLGGIWPGLATLTVAIIYLLFNLSPATADRSGDAVLQIFTVTATGLIAAGLLGALQRSTTAIFGEPQARRRADRERQVAVDRLDRIGAVRWEADGTLDHYNFVSAGGEQLLGYPLETWYSESKFWEHHLHPADRDEIVALRSEAITQGCPTELIYRMIAADQRVVWVRDSSEVTLSKKGIPAHVDGWMIDITAERVTQRQLRAVFAANRALTRSSPVADAAGEVIGAVCNELGWALGTLWILEEDGELMRCVKVWNDSDEDEFASITAGAELAMAKGSGLAGRVWKADGPVWVSDFAQDPEFVRASYADQADLHSAFGVPVRSAGEVLGVLEFFNRAVLARDDALLEIMDSIALQMGQFIQRHRAEARLKVRNDRIEFLEEGGEILASSLDLTSATDKICGLLVRRLADWCSLDMREDNGSISTMTILHKDGSKAAIADELKNNFSPRIHNDFGQAKVMDTGLPEFFSSISSDMVESRAYDLRHAQILNDLGFAAQIIVPLRVRGRILGTMTLVRSKSSPPFAQADLELAQEFANRAALAVDNIRLYESQKHIATTLQESLRPRILEAIPGTEAAVRYTAAGEGVEVGGDFYDVFSSGTNRWAVVIGDVSGQGARAAALTPLIRYTVRAEAMQEREPSRILTSLNEAMLQQSGEDQFCTVAYARIEQTDEGVHITTIRAGHPSPLILRAGGGVETLGEPGTMLGAVPEVHLSEHLADLGPGDALILFTDGVIEARQNSENFGEARLIERAAQCAGMGAEEIAETLEKAVIEYAGGSLSDDMVILVLRVKSG